MSAKRHPTTALVSSGLIITLGLLPLYLGQLDAWKDSVGNKARLIGLAVAAVAFLFGAWSILNHSGRPNLPEEKDEPAATETWLKAVDLMWKFAAAIAVIVTTNWFAVVLKEQQDVREKSEKKRSDEIQRLAAEDEVARHKLDQAEANTARLRELVMQLLVNDRPYVRLLGVTNGQELVATHLSSSLSVAQTLFTVALHDPDADVKHAAARSLPDGVLDSKEKFEFSKAVLDNAEKLASARQTEPDQQTVHDYRLLQALNAIQQFAVDPKDRSRAEELAARLSKMEIAAATKASNFYAQVENSKAAPPGDIERQKVDTFAPAVVLTATDRDNPKEVREATEVLQNTSAEVVSAAIQKLPDALLKKLPARVYLQIASENQREEAKTWQTKLTTAGYISPGIQNVAGKGFIPDTLEVRYFAKDSKPSAEAILQILKENGAKDGRVSYVIPSANDLRISPDIKSHFEVWAGKNSL